MSARLGDYRLTAELARDPFGTLHRAVRVEGGAFGRHALLRRFDPALLAGGLRERLGEAIAHSLRMGEARGLAPHCRIYHRAGEPWVAYDLEPGLSLADLLKACRSQGLPLGLDHVLTVMRDLAGVLERLHEKGVDHGLLVPSLVWVSFEGAVTLLDAPVAPLLREMLRPPFAPGLEALAQAPASGAARDLHLLACLGWQMLTQASKVPERPEALLEHLDAWSHEGDQPLAPALREIFARMVGLGPAFADLAAFQEASGVALHLEDHAPSTFNLAFLVHTALRERVTADLRALDAERVATWTVSQTVPILPVAPPAAPRRRRRGALWGGLGAALLAVAGGLFLIRRAGDREAEALRQALAEAQRHKAEVDQTRADLDAKVVQEAARKQQLERELALARDAARLEALARELEAARQRQIELQARQAQVRAQAEAAEMQARRLQAKAAVPVALPTLPAAPSLPSASAKPLPVPPPAPTALPTKAAADESVPRLAQAAPLRLAGPRPEGRLRLRVFVDEQGRPLRATVMEGPGGAVADAAVAAALASTFLPARRDGQPVRGWAEMGY